ADHGEALGDHGEDTHGVFLYDATLHVPLLVRLPERRSAGTRVGARVRLADIAPTIVEAVGLPVPPAMQGESLVRLTASAEASAVKKPDATGPTIDPFTPRPNTRAARSAGVPWCRGAPIGFCSSARHAGSCTTRSPIPRRHGTS